MDKIKIHTEFIKLNQLLKWANIVESGSIASELISGGQIKVNDEVEIRRGKKIYPGDRIMIENVGELLVVREGSARSVSTGVDPE